MKPLPTPAAMIVNVEGHDASASDAQRKAIRQSAQGKADRLEAKPTAK